MTPSEPSYREILLRNGLVAKVDIEDYKTLSQWRWCAKWEATTKTFYAYRREGSPLRGNLRYIRMHRVILGLEPNSGLIADHINHDTLDNRRANLRIVTKRENNRNLSLRSSNKARVKGVCEYHDRNRRWRAYIGMEGKQVNLGFFFTKEDAIEARRIAAESFYGDYRNPEAP